MKTLLTIDVGNTNVKYALMRRGKKLKFWSHPTAQTDQLCQPILNASRATVALCSVVPEATEIICSRLGKRKCLTITAPAQTMVTGMHPQMGADRVAAAVASRVLYAKSRLPVVSMTFGTATTALAIDEFGRERGGWIYPGMTMALEALSKCALLPLFKMDNPSIALGRDTESHICNGVFVGHIGVVKEMLREAILQMNVISAVLVATGGWAQALKRHGAPFHHVDDDLTLKGIYLIASRM